MTTPTLRRIKDDVIVTGPDIAPTKFKSRRGAKDWCATEYPASPRTSPGEEAGPCRGKALCASGRPHPPQDLRAAARELFEARASRDAHAG